MSRDRHLSRQRRTLAQECKTDKKAAPDRPHELIYPTVTSQEGFSGLNGCTTILGNIRISPNYTGPFVLNEVLNLTGRIYMNAVYPSENMTSFQMLNVHILHELDLKQVPDVRVPKVEHVEGPVILSSSVGGNVNMGVLYYAQMISI
ncbi:hypothetical protein BDV12DRAFT_197899 [Aspergillus spectabilis]